MKRTQLIEAGILIVGIIFGFKFIESIFVLIIQVIGTFQFDEGIDYVLPSLIITIVYVIIFIILIRKSGPIANYLGSNTETSSFPLKINKSSLLHVTFIALGLITLVQNLAAIIIYVFESFKNEVGGNKFLEESIKTISKDKFSLAAVQTIIASIIIYYSKSIANWFLSNDPVEELTLESEETEN